MKLKVKIFGKLGRRDFALRLKTGVGGGGGAKNGYPNCGRYENESISPEK